MSILMFIAITIVIFGILMLLFAASSLLSLKTKAMSHTQGTIEGIEVQSNIDSLGTYVIMLTFRYDVNGTSYHGKHILHEISLARAEIDTTYLEGTYPPNSTVDVYYFPTKPHRPYLTTQNDDTMVLVSLFIVAGTFALLIGSRWLQSLIG